MHDAADQVGGVENKRNLITEGQPNRASTFRAASLAPGGATASNLPLYFSCRRG
jgi:hypothetical protein